MPDVAIYRDAIAARTVGHTLAGIRIGSPFVLRSLEPKPEDLAGRRVLEIRRIGKRIVIALEGKRFIVVHLMIAGRLHWKAAGAKLSRRTDLVAFDFDTGTLTLTEAGTKRRASVHLVAGEDALHALDPGGAEPLAIDLGRFRSLLRRERHTLKRTLTDPRVLSGIGNAYSDEILHAAKLSPLQLTTNLSDGEVERLYHATRDTLRAWVVRLSDQAGGGFPEKVTAFRPGMAVHGKFGRPCPACGAPVQRIRYAENECDYCARCQTGGKLLADRAISRLLKEDWPRSLEAWDDHITKRRDAS